jgi:O-antigen ligase
VTGAFAGSHSANETGQLNWTIEGLNIVRGIFPFMSAPSAGQYMMLGLVGAVWLRRTAPSSPGLGSALEWAGIAVITAALLLTFSRQAWIGAFAGLGALALRKRPVWMFAVILLLFVAMTAISAPGGHGSFADYLLTASDKTTASSGGRVDLWRQALQLVPHHWALGVGPGLYATLNPDPVDPIYYAHNVFLDGLVELGAAGGLALIVVVVVAMASAFRRSATLGFGMLAAWVTANLFDDVLYFPRNGVILAAAFALAAAGDSAARQRPAARARARPGPAGW